MATFAASGISKRFGSLEALRDVSISIDSGEIHAVVGENGAGKSTLMNVMAGFVRQDEGVVSLEGRQLPVASAKACRERGIEFVHQHFMLVSELTVAENLALAGSRRLFAMSGVDECIRDAASIAESLRWQFDFNQKVSALSVGAKQRVEIVKCLLGSARFLILDEPTAVLAAEETDELFEVLRLIRNQGTGIVLIAHKLSEVMAISDRLTVLRNGRVVASTRTSDTSSEQVARWMADDLPPLTNSAKPAGAQAALCLERVSVRGNRGELAVKGVSLVASAGEVVGIGGVDGNGQVELAEALAGLRGLDSGSIRLDERPISECLHSVAYVPQDRQVEGLALDLSIEENMLIDASQRKRFSVRGFLQLASIRSWAQRLVGLFDIKARSPVQVVGELSGGNQQKVVLSRCLDGSRKMLVAVNPTRGLDITSTRFVWNQIKSAVEHGSLVALVTTDFDELAALSHRAFVMSGGTLLPYGEASTTEIGGP